jgi:hypothetical protein
MAVVFKVNSPELSSTISQSRTGPDLKEKLVFANSYNQSANSLSIDEVVDDLGQQYGSALVCETSTQDRLADLRRVVIQSELFTSLVQEPILGLSSLRSAWSSLSSIRHKDSQFDDSYAKLGRWRLKGTEELRAAENTLLSSRRNFHLLVMRMLDEDDVEVHNHICWLLSQRPMLSAKLLTTELLRRIAGGKGLTVDQWINGLEALSRLPEHYLVIFAPSIRHILLAVAREKDEDILSCSSKLKRILPIETLEDRMAYRRVVASEAGHGKGFAPRIYPKSMSLDK